MGVKYNVQYLEENWEDPGSRLAADRQVRDDISTLSFEYFIHFSEVSDNYCQLISKED